MNDKISIYLKYSSKYQLLGLFQYLSIAEEKLEYFSRGKYKVVREKIEEYIKEGYFTIQDHNLIYTARSVFW